MFSQAANWTAATLGGDNIIRDGLGLHINSINLLIARVNSRTTIEVRNKITFFFIICWMLVVNCDTKYQHRMKGEMIMQLTIVFKLRKRIVNLINK